MKKDNYLLHIGLFVATLVTTTIAGAEWVNAKNLIMEGPDGYSLGLTWGDLKRGLSFSLAFLSFLTFHEFGHYFMARYHDVKCSLPFYIPIYIPMMIVNIGSFGAVIRIRSKPETTQKFFDIGVAGPLAGFVVSVFILIYGFVTLPDLYEYVTRIHPDYILLYGGVPTVEEFQACQPGGLFVGLGSSLIFKAFAFLFADPNNLPPAHELGHYPFLVVGFITLFFTALNLLPIGQLDGGHVMYGLFGRKLAARISRLSVMALMVFGGTGLMDLGGENIVLISGVFLVYQIWVMSKLFPAKGEQIIIGLGVFLLLLEIGLKFAFPIIEESLIWLLYSFLVVRFMGVDHPGAEKEEPLSPGRKVLAWLAILIFITSFSPLPLYVGGL